MDMVVREDGKERVFPMDPGRTVTVGRAPNNAIALSDHRASREHCLIRMVAGCFQVEDLDSQNGVRVNGEKVKVQRLRPGDEIRIGEALLTLRDPRAAPAPAPAPRVPPPRGPQPWLEIVEGPGAGARQDLSAKPIVIGRSPDCDWPIESRLASGRHAEVSFVAPRVWRVRDLDSRNGVKVDGQKVPEWTMVPDRPFQIGDCIFVLRGVPEPRAAEEPRRQRRSAMPVWAIPAGVLALAAAFLVFRSRFATEAGDGSAGRIDGNLLATNADFERHDPADPEIFTGWSLRAAGSVRLQATRRGGGAALKLEGPGVPAEGWTRITADEDVPCRGGMVWECSAAFAGRDLRGAWGFEVTWRNQGGKTIRTDHSTWWNGSSVPGPIKGRMFVPGGARTAQVSVVGLGPFAEVILDDVMVRERPARSEDRAWTGVAGPVSLALTPEGCIGVKQDTAGILADGRFLLLDSSGGRRWDGMYLAGVPGPSVSPGPTGVLLQGRALDTAGGAGPLDYVLALGAGPREGSAQGEFSGSAVPAGAALEFRCRLGPGVRMTAAGRSEQLTWDGRTPLTHGGAVEVQLERAGASAVLAFLPAARVAVDEAGTMRITFASEGASGGFRILAQSLLAEERCAALLGEARDLQSSGQDGKAFRALQTLVLAHPSSAAAAEARGIMTALKASLESRLEALEREVEAEGTVPADLEERIAGLAADLAGTEFAGRVAAVQTRWTQRRLSGGGTSELPPEEGPAGLLTRARRALDEERWIVAEIFCRNLEQRYPANPEVGELPGLRADLARRQEAARARDAWIATERSKAENALANGNRAEAKKTLEGILERYPQGKWVEAVQQRIRELK